MSAQMTAEHARGPAAPDAKLIPGRALALAGGGFRASSVETGLTSGVLAVAHAMRPGAGAPPTLQGTGVYGQFASVASVSGGSWFAAELIYSERFVRLVEQMAASPGEAAALHREGWTKPLLSVGRQDSVQVRTISRMMKRQGHTGLSQDVLMLAYLWQTRFTWTNFCEMLLELTGGIDASVTLGSPVSPWAKGKAWLVAHTLTTPRAKAGEAVHIEEARRPARAITQTTAGSPGLSVYTPAVYSYTLGSAGAPAPVPYVAASAVPQDAILDYRERVGSRWPCGRGAGYGARARVGDFSNLEQGAKDLPVVSCAAASSAFMGDVVLRERPTLVLDAVRGDLAVWQGNGPAGETFSRAAALVGQAGRGVVGQAAVDGLADEAVQAVIDAGFVDPTGVGYAVRAGAAEVVAYLDNGAKNTPTDLAWLFQDSSKYATGDDHATSWPIFEQTADWMMKQYANLPRLSLHGGSRFVTAISYGTLHVTTAASSVWGVPGGSPVTLHLLGVASTVTIGYFEDLYDYDVLIQETIETMVAPENAGEVRGVIMPWFLTPADQAEQAELASTRAPSDGPSEPASTGARSR